MAYYVILHSTANLVDWFDSEKEAREALRAILREEPAATDDYAILRYDDGGRPVGAAITDGL
jgi:hypothetical protein